MISLKQGTIRGIEMASNKHKKVPIAVADGDGIGPEIMAAALHVLKEAGAELDIHKVEIGEKVYLKGHPAGIEPKTWDVIRNTEAFLKAPITTPQGGGFKSLNVTIRTTMGLFANVRPCVSYYPFIHTKHPQMDVVIIRENEEDLYTGIEYRNTPECFHALKMMTYPGCERIIRYGFEYAKANFRKKVTCFTKDNILKMSDGLFHKLFVEIAKEYPDIQTEHWIIDIGTAKLATTPEIFDVLVLPNLYGDILSDVAAQMTGSVGLAGSANIGVHGAMFEAIHGSAPRHAGENSANPSALILASVMMLVHICQADIATIIHNAWLRTIEEGIHTYDIFTKGVSKECVGTREFAQAVVDRLGQRPQTLKEAHYSEPKQLNFLSDSIRDKLSELKKELVGVDIFVKWNGTPGELGQKIVNISNDLRLSLIANRGSRVWPDTMPETLCIDNYRCRFVAQEKGKTISHKQIIQLLDKLTEAKLDFNEVQTLCTYDGAPGYTLAQEEQ